MVSMTPDTNLETFGGLRAVGHRVIPVARTLFADAESPVAIYRKLAASTPGSFLLESAEQGGIWSRYSFVGVNGFGVLTTDNDIPVWQETGLTQDRAFGAELPVSGLEALRLLHDRWTTPRLPDLPPLTGGLVGFIGWDAVRELEKLPAPPVREIDVPRQALVFVRDLLALDHKFGTITLITNVLADEESATNGDLFATAVDRLDALQVQLAQPGVVGLAQINLDASVDAHHRTQRSDFLAAVETAREHIVAGDVFQVVLSQRFDLPTDADPVDVYRVLRSLNPSPYMYLLSLVSPAGKPYSIVGSSPEALVKVVDGRVFTHPIAGSRPRGASPEADAQFEADLLADAKERSEHLMLVDLARNDLLRVCQPGSVDVTDFMRVERFSHIMHLVSVVEGDLRSDASPVDVFRATFPAGTLSGAPKPRALEIIDALEPAQRGVYGGVVGYFAFSGDADLAIAIRSATIVDGVAHVQAGAGLVLDSVAQAEFVECVNKSAAPLRAVAVAASLTKIHG